MIDYNDFIRRFPFDKRIMDVATNIIWCSEDKTGCCVIKSRGGYLTDENTQSKLMEIVKNSKVITELHRADIMLDFVKLEDFIKDCEKKNLIVYDGFLNKN